MAKEYSYDSLYLQLGIAKLDAVNDNIDAALQSVNKILETTADNSDVWLLKGHLETANKNFPEATNSYQKAYEASPDAIYYTLFIANSMVQEKRFEEAEKHVDRLLSLSPNHSLANKLKAIVLYSDKDYENAKRHADKALQNGLNDATLELISAASAYKLELYEQAYKLLKRVQPKVPDNQNVKQLLISTQLALGYVDEAVDTMNGYSVESENDGTFLSVVSMKLSDLGRQEEALNLAQKASVGGSSTSEIMLSLVQLSANDSAGIENLQSALKDQPDALKAQLGAAQYYVQFGFYEEARAVVEELLTANPENVGAMVLQGQIYQSEKDYVNAEKIYSRALDIDSKNVTAMVSLAQTHVNRQQWQEAYDLSSQAFELSTDNQSAGKIMLLTASTLGKLADVNTLVDSQQSKAPADLNLISMKAKVLALDGKISEGVNLLENLPDVDKTANTWKLIGDFYYQDQKWYDAEKSMGKNG